MLKRSFLLLRKNTAFFLLCLGLTLLTTIFFAVSILLYRGSHEVERDILIQIGATLHIGPNTAYQLHLQTIQKQEGKNDDENSCFPVLSEEVKQKILSVEGVLGIEGLNSASIVDALPLSFHNSKQHTGEDPNAQEMKDASPMTEEVIETYADSVNIVGCNNVQLYDYFRRNLSEVVVGDYPSAENPGVLISEQLAEENDLSVGDIIEIHPYSTTLESDETSGYIKEIDFFPKTASLTVVGIYSTRLYFDVSSTNIEGPTIYRVSPYNTLYTDYETATSINGKSPDIRFFDIYVDSPDNLDRVMEEISGMDCIDWEKFQITNDTEQFFQQYAGQIKKLLNLTQIMVIVSLVIGSAIFAFVLAVISMDETRDISIFLALGMKKRTIFWQVLTKYLLQSLIALPIAILLAYCIVTMLQVPLMPKLVSSDSSHVLALFSIGELDFVPRLDISIQLKDVLITFTYEVFLSMLGALLSLYRIIKYNMRQLFVVSE